MEERQAISSFDNEILIKAEIDVDNMIANFYQGAFSKFFLGSYTFESTDVVLTTTKATISNYTTTNGYFAYTVLEILSGANAGVRLAVKNNTNNVLTFFDTNTGITGSEAIKIYQLAKAPFYSDTDLVEDTYFKTINEKIKEAVAFQYVFRSRKQELDELKAVSSYNVSSDSYSENYDTGKEITIKERFSPQALDVLGSLAIQSI